MADRRRRKQNNPFSNAANIVTAAALVVIAIFLVVFVGLYIKNNLNFGNILPGSDETLSPENTDESQNPDDARTPEYGLVTLSDGGIVYAMTQKEASLYDSDLVLDAYEAETRYRDEADPSFEVEAVSGEERYFLVNSWLDLDYNLYRFDEYGRAFADTEYSERAFVYGFDTLGRAESIEYNSRYSETAVSGYENYPGIQRTKALWVYMDTARTLENYVGLMYKKTTESSPDVLGTESAVQYASPYAYEIYDKDIYYLAVEGTGLLSELTKNIEGRVFCMRPGEDTRYIYAGDSVGFKVVATASGDPVVYSYDGRRLERNGVPEEDENLVVFTEDMSYRVSIENNRAYLELTSGQRVTMETTGFKAGNFTYTLSSDGEILAIAEKSTVNTGGYTYYIQHGTSFGTMKSRVLRKSSGGTVEVISSEFDGTTGNLHYDYDSSSMIAEYTDSSGRGGILKISLDGDVDILDEASARSEVTLYAIQNSTAVLKKTEEDGDSFYTARINVSTPLAVAVDPMTLTENEEQSETSPEVSETPAASETSEAPTTAPSPTSSSYESYSDTSVGSGPGGGDTGNDGVIYNGLDTSVSVGPGGN